MALSASDFLIKYTLVLFLVMENDNKNTQENYHILNKLKYSN